MENISDPPKTSDICALITGANKGIGFSIARQLAQKGITVILTARSEKLGVNAVEVLQQELGVSNITFHQLDVQDPLSVARLAQFVKECFQRLDILVNNAGALGASVDEERLKALNISSEMWISGKAASLIPGVLQQTYDDAVTCVDTNYYGCKRVTEALLPLLQSSNLGARIVNLTSERSLLKAIPGESIRQELGDIDNLDEAKIDQLLQKFMQDFKEERLKSQGWTTLVPAYNVSKAALNAYTRVLARRHAKIYINCVHPGYVKTDINWNSGVVSPEEGARGPVMLALMPDGGPSGCYFEQTNMVGF
ncbi:uncharacterized protein A4U43_C05F320 [Asparagus officinalis]|uniref:Uncharacterized protein n=1 Tax=Asparagus officinalis TaxID=4686 RepID=A0A5P1EP76_ASPOF|nr:short-chain dehydrogenase/reductase 2b-like [Asparagus officinalis]ONK67463.1 uncharacterized protein A4U43_C05F320 [Asparagus officinalis]